MAKMAKTGKTAEEVGNAIMQRHEKHLANFLTFANSAGLPKLEELLTNPEALDTALVNYFDHLIESGHFEMNFSSLLVDLRSVLFTKSGQTVDIQIAHEYPKTSEFRCLLNGTTLKEYLIANIFVLMQNMSALMQPSLSSTSPEFQKSLQKIPTRWHQNYNALVQYGVMFLFHYLFDIQEFECMKKSDLAKVSVKSHQTGQILHTYYRLKTHDVGQIPFATNKLGFNPGVFMERYLSKLNRNQDLLFQVPLKMTQNEPIWYKNMLLPGSHNVVLVELASICGVKKNLTVEDFKIARELFKKNLFFMNSKIPLVKKAPIKRKIEATFDPSATSDPLTTVHSELNIKQEKCEVNIKQERLSDDESDNICEPQVKSNGSNQENSKEGTSKDQEIAALKVRVRQLEGQLKIKDEALKHLKTLHDEHISHFQSITHCMDRTSNIFQFMNSRKRSE